MTRLLHKGLAVLALGALAAAGHGGEPQLQARLDRLEAEFQELRGALKIPGLSIAVVKDQRLLWAKGLGFADLEQRLPSTDNTPYRIASLTKPFAATLALQLVEQKKLSLDDPLSKYHEHFQTDRVRVRHILAHTAAAFGGGKPGDKYQYSGSFFGYLTFVVQKCSGKSFRDQLVTQILEPLRMEDSVPGQDVLDGPDALRAEVRTQYQRVLKRLAKPYTLYGADQNIQSPYPPPGINSSAGLISTVVDLAKFDTALDRDVLLTAESRALAWTPTIANDGKRLPYGLGWFVQAQQGRKLVWHYGQWPTFSSLLLKVPEKRLTLILLANSTGVSAPFPMAEGDVLSSPFAVAFIRTFVLEDEYKRALPAPHCQLDAEGFSRHVARLEPEAGGYEYGRESEAHAAVLRYLAKSMARVRKEVKVDVKILETYVGRYALASKQEVTITRRNGGVSVEYPGQPKIDLFPESETQFFVKIADAQVSFAKDKEGRVTHLMLRLSGKEQKATRIE